jgi:hypothetical protein
MRKMVEPTGTATERRGYKDYFRLRRTATLTYLHIMMRRFVP